LFRSFQGKPVAMNTSATITGSIRVYDPAMCCSTGVCGPSVDTQLLQITRDLRWFEAQGIQVERFNLAQQPDAFVENARIAGLLQAFGAEALPATLVNDTIVTYGRYPSREEMTTALTSDSSHQSTQLHKVNEETCDPDRGCCC
jgi:hypothetical protein